MPKTELDMELVALILSAISRPQKVLPELPRNYVGMDYLSIHEGSTIWRRNWPRTTQALYDRGWLENKVVTFYPGKVAEMLVLLTPTGEATLNLLKGPTTKQPFRPYPSKPHIVVPPI